MITPYPLHWPIGYDRSSRPQVAKFDRHTFAHARDELLRELKLLGAIGIVISSNMPLRQDGYPKAARRQPDDPAVAVYFNRDMEQLVLACDQWHRVEDNLWAVMKTVGAMRGIARWGCSDMLQRAFSGFKALPAVTTPDWANVLGIDRNASYQDAKDAYHRLAKKHHPDMGGDADKFREVQDAWHRASQSILAEH